MAAALDYMHCGDLVPDSTVREMVRERGCLLVLDGFPGTLGQDETLSQLMEKENLELSAVVNYELPVAEIVSRLSGRRICEKCKAVFHVTRQPSRSEGICDEWGGRLFQFYRQLGLLVPVAATGSPEEICARTMSALEKRPVSLL
jgi:adenylate kinase